MKILLLGGAGFIGSRTALRLAEAGHEVVVADSLDPQIHGSSLADSESLQRLWGKVPVVCADTRDAAAVDRVLGGMEAVYYFPAGTGTGQSMYQVERYTDINVRGAAVFCEALSRHRDSVHRVVVSSSRAIYGEGAAVCPTHGRIFPASRRVEDLEAGRFASVCPVCGIPAVPAASREEDPARPVSIYGITKLAQEQLVANVCQALAIPSVTFRYQNVYGPGQSLNNAYTGILSIFSQLLLAGREINLFEDGLPTRDFVFIDDLVEYNVRALSAELPGGSAVMNLGSGVRTSLADLVNGLAQALGLPGRSFVSGQFRLGDIRDALADLNELTKVLGPHDFVSLKSGLEQFVSWVQAQGVRRDANDRFDRSLTEMRTAGLLRGGAAE